MVLSKLKTFIIENDKVALPVKEDEIEKIENKYTINFPTVYKEFLKLAGGYFVPLNSLGHRFRFTEKIQSDARQNLKEYGLEHLMPKNWWVVAGDGDYILYIDLDEESDDPSLYVLDMDYYEGHEEPFVYGKVFDKFSDWIKEVIDKYIERNEDKME